MEPKDRIIVALDVDDPIRAMSLVEDLASRVGCFKIGLEFINSMLASLIAPKAQELAVGNLQTIRELFKLLKGNILWDGKFDDIPNTVGGASKGVVRIGVKMFNVHASAGKEAVAQAVANKGNSLVLGVTVLTSIAEDECVSIFGDKPDNKVLHFARMLNEAGADGIICSPKELATLSGASAFDGLLKVTPGVRPAWAAKGDQKRVMTPADAIKAGADYLVIGRPIRQPPEEIGSPVEAAKKIAEEIAGAIPKGM